MTADQNKLNLQNIGDKEVSALFAELFGAAEEESKTPIEKLEEYVNDLKEVKDGIEETIDSIRNTALDSSAALPALQETLEPSFQSFLALAYNIQSPQLISEDEIQRAYSADKIKQLWTKYVDYVTNRIRLNVSALESELTEYYNSVKSLSAEEAKNNEEIVKKVDEYGNRLTEVLKSIYLFLPVIVLFRVPFLLYLKNTDQDMFNWILSDESLNATDEQLDKLAQKAQEFAQVNANAVENINRDIMLYLAKKYAEYEKIDLNQLSDLKEIAENPNRPTIFDRIPLADMLALFTGKPRALISPKKDTMQLFAILTILATVDNTNALQETPITRFVNLVVQSRITSMITKFAEKSEQGEKEVDIEGLLSGSNLDSLMTTVIDNAYKLIKRFY